MNNVFLAFALTLIAGLSTGIGSCIAFFAKHTNRKFLSISLGFSAGVMMKTFTGSQIENHPFVIFMTSGNYRRMLTALYYVIQGSEDQKEYRRQAVNYGFVVGSFVVGAVVSALLMHIIYIKSIWLITLSLITIMVYYSSEVKRLGLKETNL